MVSKFSLTLPWRIVCFKRIVWRNSRGLLQIKELPLV
jgi:hypothetical protein